MVERSELESAIAQARHLSQQKRPDSAVEMIDRAFRIDPHSVEAHYVHISIIEHHPEAKGVHRKSYLARARSSVKALHMLNPQNPLTHEAEARVETLAGDLNAAVVAVTTAIQLDPHRSTGHEILAALIAQTKTRAQPEHVLFDEALEVDSFEYHLLRAKTLAHYGLGKQAIDHINSALLLDPISPAAHLANIEVVSSHPERTHGGKRPALMARARISSAALLQHAPGQATSHEAAALVSFIDRDFEEAAASAEQAIAIDPNRTDAHRILGDSHQRLGRKKEAAAAYVSAARVGDEASAAPIVNSFKKPALIAGALPVFALLAFGRSLARVIPPEALAAFLGAIVVAGGAYAIVNGIQNRRREKLVEEQFAEEVDESAEVPSLA